MMGRDSVSVVIVCMNNLENLFPCLASIYCHTKVDFEILVVAYLFSEENLARLKDSYPEVKIIESNSIRGFSENNNLALRLAKGDYCFVLNDDTEFSSDVIGSLLRDFPRLPDNAAIVTPKLLNSDGSLQLCGRPPYPPVFYALQQWHLYSEPKDDTLDKSPVFEEVFLTSNICGAAFLIKTEIFRQSDWFDENYFFTPEDIALSEKLRSEGYGVYVDREVEVYHKARTTASRMFLAVRPAAIKGSLMFFSHGSSLRFFLLSVAVFFAEFAKFLKASLKFIIHPSDKNLLNRRIFWENCRAICSRKTPKQIFVAAVEKWKLL